MTQVNIDAAFVREWSGGSGAGFVMELRVAACEVSPGWLPGWAPPGVSPGLVDTVGVTYELSTVEWGLNGKARRGCAGPFCFDSD